MTSLIQIWDQSSNLRKGLFVAALTAILALVVFSVYWVMRPSYQALFTNLRPQDAATITAELDKQKINYKLESGGATILVPDSQVHSARIKVLGKDLPLSGTVGFELFNNADLGLTEFAQKVNYQRALQGELARTIMSLESVESARVHLALPDSGFLRRTGSKPKASVTVATKSSAVLEKSVIRGIQRLVAAAVPDLELADVAVLNQSGQGMAHQTRTGESLPMMSDPRLDLKFEMENHYAQKIVAHADRIFGPGRTRVDVDLVLNFDHTKIMSETTSSNVTGNRPPPAETSRASSESSTEAVGNFGDPENVPAKTTAQVSKPAPLSQDATGKRSSLRRVEEVVAAPGSIRRLSVGILVDGEVEKADLERLKALVISSVGLNLERGDNIGIFSHAALPKLPDANLNQTVNAVASGSEPTKDPVASAGHASTDSPWGLVPWVIAALLVLGGIWLLYGRLLPGRQLVESKRSLTESERDRLASRLAALLENKEPAA